ncbi:hypothetical protein [Acidianus sp. HS-5]|uniref:hypothetical protein n=1 Tax=Acidianus sp. HS-5 TaxID=2886040 RepID=UPI001F1739D9|nr:hypothetical protein [Acidianus sp. HS-5]BDC17815.1 hypothetical protein HS5_07050 [Acidianus sp. HS-5]
MIRAIIFFVLGVLLILSIGFVYSYFFENQTGVKATAYVTNIIETTSGKIMIHNIYCFTINVRYGCHTLTLLPGESKCISNATEIYITSPYRPCFLLIVNLK